MNSGWESVPYLFGIVKKQCEFANVNFDSIDFNEDLWQDKYTWTNEQQNEFKKWLVKFLKDTSKARKEIMAFPSSKTIKVLNSVVEEFVLQYGFKITNNEV